MILNPQTIKSHVANIYAKNNIDKTLTPATKRSELRRLALEYRRQRADDR